MAAPQSPRRLRVGVDVGGTNTDGVVLDPTETLPDKGIKAWHKAATTTDPSDGINDTLVSMFRTQGVGPADVSSVTIGTTHFVNAVVEADSSRLSPVAVLRLCGPFSKHVPPCLDWRDDLRNIILGHYALLKGGLEVDGDLISDIDEEEIKNECAVIREKGIRSIVVNGVFSPIDTVERQEDRAADIIKAELPGCDVVCSKDVANLGFLERENAAILNAAILHFARKTIRSFQQPIKQLGLKCPIFIAQNDGTVLSGDVAAHLPIRTFSSGPTNSMRGAAFLVQQDLKEDAFVVDIGGTTADVGLLQANGFPRQRAAYSDLAGVRMNFPGPDIRSIGLAGGSIVRRGWELTVGPDSVGHKLSQESVIFGGSTLTATDLTVLGNPSLSIGDRSLVQNLVSNEELAQFSVTVKQKLERIIDTMKTSPGDIPVILVGGGAVIAPEALQGASYVLKPRWSEVANAVGAAIARVSAVVDTVKSTEPQSASDILDKVKVEAVQRTVDAGALPSSVHIAEVDTLSLPVSCISILANITLLMRFLVCCQHESLHCPGCRRVRPKQTVRCFINERRIREKGTHNNRPVQYATAKDKVGVPRTESPYPRRGLHSRRPEPHMVYLRDGPPVDNNRLLHPRHWGWRITILQHDPPPYPTSSRRSGEGCRCQRPRRRRTGRVWRWSWQSDCRH